MKPRSLTPLLIATAAMLPITGVRAEVMGCLIEPDRVADVGSQSVGVIDRLLVERGDVVVAGQVVARLAAQVERASLSVAEARSQADAELRQSVAAHDLAVRKLERAKDLLKQDFVSDQALDQAEAEARVAEHRVTQAREAQRVALREFKLSTAQLGQRDVRSPFEGVVIERYRTEGERIEREPLVRVARMDPLRVEVIVPASQFGSIIHGQMAKVRTDLPNFSSLDAKVVLVDRVIDPGSNSFRVRLTLPNPDHRIPSGLRCKLDFSAIESKAPPAEPKAALPKAAQAKPAAIVPMTPVSPVPPAATARGEKLVDVALPSGRVVENHRAPERMLVKQYMGSKEPRLALTPGLTKPASSALDTERPILSLR